MLKLLNKTKFLFLLLFALYVSVPAAYYIMIQVGLKINALYFGHLPLNILLPGCLIIGAGIASFYSLVVVKGVIWWVNQALVVAATVVVNGLPYKGSLTIYSFSEVNKSLLIFSAKSVISKKTFKWVAKIKDKLLNAEILQGIFNHKWLIVRKAADILRASITNTLDFADEVLVSYTWMTMNIYKKFGPDGKSPKFGKMIKNQALFFLEGFVMFIRVFPKLVVGTIFPSIGVTIFTFLAFVGVLILCLFVFGISWSTTFWILFFWSSIAEWIEKVFIQYTQTLIILDKFYRVLHVTEPVTKENIIQTVSGIPILANIAKKTGIKEFQAMQFQEECPAGLMDITSIESALSEEAKHVAEVLDINSEEPEPEPDTDADEVLEDGADLVEEEEEQAEEEGLVAEVVKAEEIPVPEETPLKEKETEEAYELPTTLVMLDDDDDDDFSFDGMPVNPSGFVKKFESSGGGSDERE